MSEYGIALALAALLLAGAAATVVHLLPSSVDHPTAPTIGPGRDDRLRTLASPPWTNPRAADVAARVDSWDRTRQEHP